MPPNLKDILQFDVLESFGLTNASEEEKDKALEHVTVIILGEVADRIEASLSEEKQEEFRALFRDPASSEEKRMKFLRDQVPDFEDMVLEETFRFKLEMIEEEKEDEDK